MVSLGSNHILGPLFIFLFDLLYISGFPVSLSNSGTCDQTIWDETRENRGVYTAAVSCMEGEVSWRHPYSALRIIFTLPPPRKETDIMEVCFKSKIYFTSVKISLEETDSNSHELLRPLLTLDPSDPHMVRELCFMAQDVMTLFVETETDQDSLTIGQFDLQYDIQRKSSSSLFQDPLEECRPCTDEELLLAACSSDFVVNGAIDTVKHDDVAQETELNIAVNKVIHQRSIIFRNNMPSSIDNEVTKRKTFTENLGYSSSNYIESTGSNISGAIYAPRHCGIHKGAGSFMFLGRIRLGRAILQCAPRVEDFHHLWRQSLSEGRNLCTVPF